jgi:sialic acid synthase SpsE
LRKIEKNHVPYRIGNHHVQWRKKEKNHIKNTWKIKRGKRLRKENIETSREGNKSIQKKWRGEIIEKQIWNLLYNIKIFLRRYKIKV